MTGFEALCESWSVLEAGANEGLHVGAQFFVSLAGETVVDAALGLARPGVPMRPDSMMTWFSCSKIATSIAVARVLESGSFALDDPVAQQLPEFGCRGKEDIRIRDLFTHTAGLLDLEQTLFAVRYANSFDQKVQLICEASLDPGAVPGERAGYQTPGVTLLLAELARRKTGRAFPEYCPDEIFLPRGMKDSWLGMSRTSSREST